MFPMPTLMFNEEMCMMMDWGYKHECPFCNFLKKMNNICSLCRKNRQEAQIVRGVLPRLNSHRISLVIPTLGRVDTVDRLLQSMCALTAAPYEILIVDQNDDPVLTPIVEKYRTRLPLNHLRVSFRGAARARNYGAFSARGDILAFPDDDGQMAKDALEFVKQYFVEHPDVDVLSGFVADPDQKQPVLHFLHRESKITMGNIFRTTCEPSFYIRRDAFVLANGFDEKLGTGTYFGAEESSDLMYRLLCMKLNLQYVPRILFYHPGKSGYQNYCKAFSYGLGFGGFARKHLREVRLIPLCYFLYYQLKSLANILYGCIAFDFQRVKFHCYFSLGRWVGFFKWN